MDCEAGLAMGWRWSVRDTGETSKTSTMHDDTETQNTEAQIQRDTDTERHRYRDYAL